MTRAEQAVNLLTELRWMEQDEEKADILEYAISCVKLKLPYHPEQHGKSYLCSCGRAMRARHERCPGCGRLLDWSGVEGMTKDKQRARKKTGTANKVIREMKEKGLL